MATVKGNRARGGVLMYSYGGTNAGPDGKEQNYNEEFYASLSAPSKHAAIPPFATPVSPPSLPWKERPALGHIKGTMLEGATLSPLDGGRITLIGQGVRREQRTDGTGFYAFIDLKPGVYRMLVRRPSGFDHERRTAVAAGRVTTSNGLLGPAAVRMYPNVENAAAVWRNLGHDLPVRLKEQLVVGGTDVFPGNLYVRSSAVGTNLRLRLKHPPVMPLQAGDIVSVTGMLTKIDGEMAVDGAEAVLVDIIALEDRVASTSAQILKRMGLPMAGTLARVYGKVAEVRPDRFIVDAGTPVEVMLSGRKDPGVEAEEEPLIAPGVGTKVEVTGVASVTLRDDGTTLNILRPRTPADIKELPATTAERIMDIAWRLSVLPFRGPGLGRGSPYPATMALER
jgi:hypothetical protein